MFDERNLTNEKRLKKNNNNKILFKMKSLSISIRYHHDENFVFKKRKNLNDYYVYLINSEEHNCIIHPYTNVNFFVIIFLQNFTRKILQGIFFRILSIA